jgi:tRNA A-37 threonylcarbamoyl transferase component Bud32
MTAGLVGSRLGRYEVLEEIGQGGMSVVYRANDTQLKREVAVKVMHAFLAEQEEARERFHREAVAVARLRHPHIIEIFDYSGEGAAQSYIVTELVHGRSLADLLRQHPLAVPEIGLVLARPIAEALSHAHAQGVIHRDLKPENILVGNDGALKLTDFGIARMLDSHTLTVTGTLLGSPAYMAPEYVEGYATDERADIFSFGAMLYQFAVGKLPFEAPTPHALLKRIATGEYVRPQQANPQIHAAMGRLIERCLARVPEHRYRTAGELLADLDLLLRDLALDPQRDLPALLSDPDGFAERVRQGLPARYLALGKAALAEKSSARAIEHFDRVLGLDANNAEVRRILDRLARRAWARRVGRDAVLVLLGTLLVSWAGAAAIDAVRAWRAAAQATPVRVAPPPPEKPPPAPRNVPLDLQGRGDVYVDGSLELKNVTGNQAVELLPGTYRLRFVGEQRVDEKEVVIEETGPIPAVPLNGTMAPAIVRPPPPKVRDVTFLPAGAVFDVYLDDQPVPVKTGAMGKFNLSLTHGTHRLAFINKDYKPYIVERFLVSDTEPPDRVVVRLEPNPAKLFIRGAPNGAVVEVAGKRALITDRTRDDPVFVPLVFEGDASSQALEVVVKLEGHQEWRKRVQLHSGEQRNLEVELKPL